MTRTSLFAISAGCAIVLFQNCAGKFEAAELASFNSELGSTADPLTPATQIHDPLPPPIPDLNSNLKLIDIPANTALDLGLFQCSEPSDATSCKPGTDYSRITYDSSTHQVFSWGGVMYQPANILPKIGLYDVATGKWGYSKIVPSYLMWYYASAAEYDPISKMIIIVNGTNGSVYDPATDEVIATFPTGLSVFPGDSNNLIYFPPTDKMYYVQLGSFTGITEVTLDRTNWSKTSGKVVNTSGPTTKESGWAYDSRNHVIGGGVANGKIHIYDPIKNTWVTETMKIQSDLGLPI